jgi:hypothetical protein
MGAVEAALWNGKVMKALELYEPGLIADLLALNGGAPDFDASPLDLDATLDILEHDKETKLVGAYEAYLHLFAKTMSRLKDMASRPPGSTGNPPKLDKAFAAFAAEGLALGEQKAAIVSAEKTMLNTLLCAKMTEHGIGVERNSDTPTSALKASRERAARRTAKKMEACAQNGAPFPVMVRPKELAAIINYNEEKLYRLRKAGKGPPFVKKKGSRAIYYDLALAIEWARSDSAN